MTGLGGLPLMMSGSIPSPDANVMSKKDKKKGTVMGKAGVNTIFGTNTMPDMPASSLLGRAGK